MAFAFVLPSSRVHIEAAGAEDARPVDADRAAAALRADFERWSRWGLGVGAFVLAVLGVFLSIGLTSTIAMLGGVPGPLDVVVIVVAAVAGAAGIWMLLALWRSGRRLLRAASWWMRLPYVTGARQRRASGWIEARTVNFEGPIFARLTTVSLAMLLGVLGVSVLAYEAAEGPTSLTAAAVSVGVLALVAGCVQAGGVMRIVSAVSERDPLWVRIRSTFRRAD